MGVKEGYLIAAGFKSSTVAAVEEHTDQSITAPDITVHVPDATSVEKCKLKCSAIFDPHWSDEMMHSFVSLYRHRKHILHPAWVSALISVIVGLVLGDIISIITLVVSLPTLIAFFAHWRSVIADGSVYAVKWYIGFTSYFLITFSASLCSMLSDAAKISNARGVMTYRNQAVIMIGIGFVIYIALFFCLFPDKRQKTRSSFGSIVSFWFSLPPLFFVAFGVFGVMVTGSWFAAAFNSQFVVILCVFRSHASKLKQDNPTKLQTLTKASQPTTSNLRIVTPI